MYYIKAAGAGGICCSVTNITLFPIDVVKTRIQLDTVKNKRMYSIFAKLVAEQGLMAFTWL